MSAFELHPLLAGIGVVSPVLQAPMAGVSTPALAAAVSNAGGLGALGLGAMSAERARQEIAATRALTDRPFQVNVFCHARPEVSPERERAWIDWLTPLFRRVAAAPPEQLQEIYTSFVDDAAMQALLVESRPAVVSFHFGLPERSVIEALRAAGIILLASATSLHEARQVQAAGLDAVVAQGIEAGGHRGVFDPTQVDAGLGSEALTRQLVGALSIPVIAAGGIMDGRGVAEALAWGACAAQLGTAFVACPESAADAAYRAGLQNARPHDTVMTSAISGRPARGLANALTRRGAEPDAPPPADYPRAYHIGKLLHAASSKAGSAEHAAHWAGQAVARSRAMPAAALMSVLQRELAEALRDG